MKKLTALLLVLVLCCAALPAPAEEDVTGEWYAPYHGTTVMMKLEADNTYSIVMSGLGTVSDGTWTFENGTLTLTGEDSILTGALADGKLTVADDLTTFEFSREPVTAEPAYVPAEANAEAVPEDYNGTWTAAYADLGQGFTTPASEGNNERLVIEDGKIRALDEESALGFYFSGDAPVEMAFEGGALVYVREIPNDPEPLTLTIRGELLRDGILALTIDLGYGANIMYLVKAEAEEPAA